jgi:putative ABC transport system substrate-binding protein
VRRSTSKNANRDRDRKPIKSAVTMFRPSVQPDGAARMRRQQAYRSAPQVLVSLEKRNTDSDRPLRKSGGQNCCNAQHRVSLSNVVRCNRRPEGTAHEATGLHHASRRYGGRLASRHSRAAAAANAAHRVLETIPPQANAANFDALRKGLRELGYDEGRSLIIEYRSADGRAERFPALAAELVRLNVDVIVTRGTPSALAARNATRTIPIVMASVGDVIGTGLAVSLARPAGNVTGLTAINTDTKVVPGLVRIAALYNMGNPTFALRWKEVELAARALGAESQLLDVRKPEDIAPAFAAATAQRAGALLTSVDALTQANQRTILELAAKHRLPAIYPTREFVENGGLMAYGVSFPDLYRRAATYIDKIFKGARPADLPIEQPTRFELVINLKAAKALGLTVPPTLLARADEPRSEVRREACHGALAAALSVRCLWRPLHHPRWW